LNSHRANSANRKALLKRISHAAFIFAALRILLLLVAAAATVPAQDFKSGQDSPVHDSDRLYPLGDKRIPLENDSILIEFDETTGALTHFENKRTHWQISARSELAESFEMFVPLPERDYNPVLGARNRLQSIVKSTDGTKLTMVWDNLESEYAGKLPIRFEATVTLSGYQVAFNGQIENHSQYSVSSVEWPILGDLKSPAQGEPLVREYSSYGNLVRTPLYPDMPDELGYYGTNFPTIEANNGGYGLVRYVLISAKEQGLYCGTHDTSGRELVSYVNEIKPGYESSYLKSVPERDTIDGHAARMVFGAVHFPFLNAGESGALSTTVFNPYEGDWHHGVDIYRSWKATWFKTPVSPPWVADVNSWQQLQINSSE
jgi:hypothetical protein